MINLNCQNFKTLSRWKIYNFEIFSYVLNCGHNDLTFWMFPVTCWNESFNYKKIGKKTRLFLMECALFGFKKFYDIAINCN